MIALRAGSATDVGLVRSNNQDTLLIADGLYAVADGMGGAAAGEVASALAVEALGNGFSRTDPATPDNLIQAAQTANRAVWDEAEANPEMRGMGTTLVALALVEGPQLAIVNIGDSRLYRLHDGELTQVTYDHNLVAEMVAEGRISKEEAEVHPRRNIMTRALGVEPEVPVDLFVEDPVVGDRYMLCSDGLPREVSDEAIAALLRRLDDPGDAAKELVEEAKRRGGNDNITVVVVDVVDDGAAGASPDGAAAGAGDDTTRAVRTVPGAKAEAPATAPPKTPATAPPTTPPTAPAEPADGADRARRSRFSRLLPVQVQRTGAGRRLVTVRVIVFVLVLLLVLGGGAAGVVWYARSAYFVGLRQSHIVIFQGRPGGVLWLKPTVAEATPYTTSDVLAVHVPTLQSGQQEPDLAGARAYVTRLVDEKKAAAAAQAAAAAAAAAAAQATTTAPPTAPTTPPAPTTTSPSPSGAGAPAP